MCQLREDGTQGPGPPMPRSRLTTGTTHRYTHLVVFMEHWAEKLLFKPYLMSYLIGDGSKGILTGKMTAAARSREKFALPSWLSH